MIVNQFVLTRNRGKEEGEKLRLTKIYIDGFVCEGNLKKGLYELLRGSPGWIFKFGTHPGIFVQF